MFHRSGTVSRELPSANAVAASARRPAAPVYLMRIRSVRAFLLSYPFDEPIRMSYYGGERVIFKRDAMLVRVETDNGLVGYAPGQGTQQARDLVDDVIGPFLTD